MLEDDVFVGGVGSFADGTHAVQGGGAEGRGEVAVGASSGRGFFQVETELGGLFASLFEEGDGGGGALHGWAVDASGDREGAVGIGGAQGGEEAFDGGGVGQRGDADVDLGVGLGGDDG